MGIELIRAIKDAAGKRVRTHRINRRSDKRKMEDKEFVRVKAEALKAHPVCQFPGCEKKSVDVHHTEGRVGKNYLNKKKMKALCRGHHVFVELNPKMAKQMNLSNSRLNKNDKA